MLLYEIVENLIGNESNEADTAVVDNSSVEAVGEKVVDGFDTTNQRIDEVANLVLNGNTEQFEQLDAIMTILIDESNNTDSDPEEDQDLDESVENEDSQDIETIQLDDIHADLQMTNTLLVINSVFIALILGFLAGKYLFEKLFR